MRIGTKVGRRHDDYIFNGVVVGDFIATDGRRLVAVEQDGTGMVQVYYENQIYERDGFGWVDDPAKVVAAKPLPPPKIPLPFELFIPVQAIPAAGANRRSAEAEIRLNYLPKHPYETLISEPVHADIEFHFAKQRSPGDLDNLLKPTLDLLKGSVLVDDRLVWSLSSRFIENSPTAGFAIKLTKHEAKK